MEDREVTIARFLNGLNHDIANIVELKYYIKLKDIAHMAMKVERKLKRKNNTQKVVNSGLFLSWKLNYRKYGVAPNQANHGC